MKILFLLSLLLTEPTHATTKAKISGQPSQEFCQIRAKYLKPLSNQFNIQRKGKKQTVDEVFWKVDILEVSNPKICPAVGENRIRIRSAMIDPSENRIIYRVGIDEPRENTQVDLRIEYSKGEDSHTKVKFEEWFLKEVVRE